MPHASLIQARSAIPRLVLVAAAWLVSGCEATIADQNSSSILGDAGCDPELVLKEACGTSKCHQGNDLQSGLDLLDPNVEDRLVGQPSSDEDCSHRILIDPENPLNSYLVEKLVSTEPECGDRMPDDEARGFGENELECLLEWAEELAANADGGM